MINLFFSFFKTIFFEAFLERRLSSKKIFKKKRIRKNLLLPPLHTTPQHHHDFHSSSTLGTDSRSTSKHSSLCFYNISICLFQKFYFSILLNVDHGVTRKYLCVAVKEEGKMVKRTKKKVSERTLPFGIIKSFSFWFRRHPIIKKKYSKYQGPSRLIG